MRCSLIDPKHRRIEPDRDRFCEFLDVLRQTENCLHVHSLNRFHCSLSTVTGLSKKDLSELSDRVLTLTNFIHMAMTISRSESSADIFNTSSYAENDFQPTIGLENL